MRYLTFSADYNNFIKDEFDSDFLFEELELPNWLIRDIFVWYEEYRKIIPINQNERLLISEDIDELDKKGIDIVKQMKLILGDEFKIKYFSEGKLTYIYY